MRLYVLAALIAFAGLGMIAGAATVHYTQESSAPSGAEPSGPTAQAAAQSTSGRGGDRWGANYFPNTELVTHEGERVHFFDDLIKDKVVAMNFMYTSCPDTCPVQTSRMLQVAKLLEDRLGEDIYFYSITIDPERDTQKALQEYAASWNIPDGWTFLTGDRDDIIHLRKKLGMRLDDVRSGDFADHSINLLMGNQSTGRWMKRTPFENPYVLANQLGSWLHDWKGADWDENEKFTSEHADSPALRQIGDGEYIYRNRCQSCHTIGEGDVRKIGENQVGPDLFNVTQRRDREWLERWIAEPDKMLEEKDPLAMELYKAYNEVPMPNMRLSDKDVDALLGYIARESRRIRYQRAGKSDDHQHHHAKHDHQGNKRAKSDESGHERLRKAGDDDAKAGPPTHKATDKATDTGAT